MLKKFVRDEKQRRIIRFVLKATALYLLWFFVYDSWLAPQGKLDDWLNARVAADGTSMLRLLGYEAGFIPGINQYVMQIDGTDMVGVGNPCNGLELFALFTGFILCFPGNWKTKAWFIPAGILLIHFVNVIRAAVLVLIQKNAPEHLDFNHHYTFTILVYSVIFLLWMAWANRFSPGNSTPSSPQTV